MKRILLLLAGIVFLASLSNGSCLQAQSIPMSLTAPGANNVLRIQILASTSLLGNSSDTKPFNMTGGYTLDLDATYDDYSRAPTLNTLAFQLDNPGNILMNNTSGDFHLSWFFGTVNEYISTTTLRSSPMSPNGPMPVTSETSFDMIDHGFQINQGVISWRGVSSTGSPLDCGAIPINLIPASSSPSTVQVTRTSDAWTSSSYNTYMKMPISIPSTQLTSGSITGLGTYAVFMSGTGTAEAGGTFTQDFSPTAAYWDTSLTAGLQAGSGNWSLSAQKWSVSSAGAATLLGWYSGGSDLDVFFNPNGTSTITVSENAAARSLTFSGTGYTINSSGAATLTLSDGAITAISAATLNATLAGTNGLTKSGPAKLTLGGANIYIGLTTVASGTLELAPAAQNCVLNVGGADIQAGRIVFDYAGAADPAATIRSLLAASYHGGLWDVGQFTNSTAAATGLTLGCFDDTSAGQVKVMATYPGDFNLDGMVDNFDRNIWFANAFTGTNWQQGDANYDGEVNGLDRDLWFAHAGLPPIAGSSPSAASAIGIPAPEPGTLALLFVALLSLRTFAWRKRR
jgi:autotransporter-associated beta strand protein